MKRPLFAALGLSMLLTAPAFACDADHTAIMRSQLNKSNSPSNVKTISLQQKAAYCEQNANNLGLGGDKKARYLGSCMNKNEALERQATARPGTI